MNNCKNLKKIICFLLCYALIASFLTLQIVKAATSTSTIINNSSSLVLEGKSLYYTQSSYNEDNFQGIYKINIDGTKNAKISNVDARAVTIDGDWIYFKSGDTINRMKKDGTKLKNLKANSYSSYYDGLYFVGDWLYYFDCKDQSFNKIKKDGTGKTKIISKIAYLSGQVVGNYIYYVKEYDKKNHEPIWFRANLDGSKQTPVNKNIQQVTDKYVYYYSNYKLYKDTKGNYHYSGTLYRMKPDGSGTTKVGDFKDFNISVINDDWVYNSGEKAFKKIGTNKIIKESGVKVAKLMGAYIQYYKTDDKGNWSYNAVKTDGTKRIKVYNGWEYRLQENCVNDGKYFYYIANPDYKGKYLYKLDINKGTVVMKKKLLN